MIVNGGVACAATFLGINCSTVYKQQSMAMQVLSWLLIWALVVAQFLIILMYAAQLFIIRYLMKKYYNFFWLKVRCNMWFFFSVMIIGMIIREIIYILVYPYNG